jgi:hypothetical protein
VDRFVDSARRFVQLIDLWLAGPTTETTDQKHQFLIQASVLIAELYAGYGELQELGDSTSTVDCWVEAAPVLSKLRTTLEPFNMYWEMFDPYEEGDPVCGSLSDDLADIYSEIATGLAYLDAGDESGAVDHWKTTFFHWGEHALGAMRAIHFLSLR